MSKINLIQGNCLDVMGSFGGNIIDLTITSPPYDNLRTYNVSLDWGEHVWKPVLKELFRVTKNGGVVVWVVSDATIKGSETGTSFKQALYAKDCGFNLHDTMIYLKDQLAYPDSVRYYGAFEYMFIFSKGRIKTFNPITDRKNTSRGRKINGSGRERDGSLKPRRSLNRVVGAFGVRWNYWLFYNQKRGLNTKHPASFPVELAHDHIVSWSNECDTVFDPFMGSGTTGKMAKELNRNFIGIELVEEYFKIAETRIIHPNTQALKNLL